MKKVIVFPYEHSENDYIKLQIECIERAGYHAVPQDGNRRTADYIMYNWYENMNNSGFIMLIKKILILQYYRITGKKIIWVMHNKRPHESYDRYSNFMMKYLSTISSAIMILCNESINSLRRINHSNNIIKKVYKVPLISYESLVGQIASKEPSNILSLLMFGRIMPYKCLDVLIEAIKICKHKENIRVTIVGPAHDEEYIKELKSIINDTDNVNIIVGFIGIDELKKYAERADAFVLPMDLESSLNSSAVIMAFSLGRTVICPEIGTIKDLDNGKDFVYTYSYRDKKEHVLQLSKTIDCAYEERDTLKEKGKNALTVLQRNNSVEVVAKKFEAMFKACV